jgi:hypothetical protein
MRIDPKIFAKTIRTIVTAGGGRVGPCSKNTLAWCHTHKLPKEIVDLFQSLTPKSDIWAGAGALYGERMILKYNDDFPEALQAMLFIVGSAPNGDHIAIDLVDGRTGYISHEQNGTIQPRKYFVAVSPSIGCFLRDINMDPSKIPDDYWSAKTGGI